MRTKTTIMHNGNFITNFNKSIDSAMFFSTSEFTGKCYQDGSFILCHNAGRLFHNLNPLYASGVIQNDMIEYQFRRHRLYDIICYLVYAFFTFIALLSAFVSIRRGKTILYSMYSFGVLIFPILIYFVPAYLYDNDDCRAIEDKLLELCGVQSSE